MKNTIQNLQQKSVNREMQSEQVQNENMKLSTQLTSMQEIPAKLEKTMKEKVALVKEIKSLRAQKEEMTQQFNEQLTKVNLEHFNEITKLKNQNANEIKAKNEEIHQIQNELQKNSDHFKRVHQYNRTHFSDVLCKLESFHFTLDNCAIEKLQSTTPGMSDHERREKSNDILRHLIDTFNDALKSEPVTNDDFKELSSDEFSHIELIEKLYRRCLELLCDKGAAIKKENDWFIQKYNEEIAAKNKKKNGKK